jgi:ubiquitin C-terminal hydrolase
MDSDMPPPPRRRSRLKLGGGRRPAPPSADAAPRHERPNKAHRPGLRNLGDACFISAVVQALLSCDAVRPGLIGHSLEPERDSCDAFARVSRALPVLLREMLSATSTSAVVVPRELVRVVRSAGSVFASGQHDAQEFLQFLLQSLSEGQVDRRELRFGCFHGAVSASTSCMECECATTESGEFFNTLSICCGHSGTTDARPSVASGLEAHFAPASLSGANKLFCAEHCNAFTEGQRQTRLSTLPGVLCIHLKLLNSDACRAVAVERQLDVRPWCTRANQCTRYELVAAVLHTGNAPTCGHYSALCRVRTTDRPAPLGSRAHNTAVDVCVAASAAATSPRAEDKAPQWVLCDDERVDELTEAESCKILDGDDNNGDEAGSKRRRSGAAPYLLFYVRQATTYADFFDKRT